MAASSPAVKRVIAVLSFFAEHPGQAFKLSQIIKSLGINPSTGHTILAELVEGGFLYRNTDKSYVLGPAALRLAGSAEDNLSLSDVVRKEMRALADEIGVIATALSLQGDKLVVRERAASLMHLGRLPPPGQNYPIVPWAIAFMGNRSSAEIDSWLAKAPKPLRAKERAGILDEIEFLREHGYVLTVFKADEMQQLLLGGDVADQPEGRLLAEMRTDKTYLLLSMAAPVYGRDRNAELSFALHGFARPYSGAEIADMGVRLLKACHRVGTFITGNEA